MADQTYSLFETIKINDGNVGIGTNPDSKLTVDGNLSVPSVSAPTGTVDLNDNNVANVNLVSCSNVAVSTTYTFQNDTHSGISYDPATSNVSIFTSNEPQLSINQEGVIFMKKLCIYS